MKDAGHTIRISADVCPVLRGDFVKAVLISIRPEWTRMIVSGKKTLEVRKTRPKIQEPFKCYIYQTLPKSGDWNERDGKVIGEFVCTEIIDVWPGYRGGEDCLTFEQWEKYLGENGHGYGWRITNLKVYDKPKKLNEFYQWYKDYLKVQRPPQSWCYVEELED